VEGISDPAVVRGQIKNWDSVEKVIEHLYTKTLGTDSNLLPLIYAEPTSTSEKDRFKFAEIFFEKFSIPSYFVGNECVFGVYSAGRTSSLIVDSGYAVTHALTVNDGWIVPQTVKKLNIGGNDISNYLSELLNDKGIDIDSQNANRLKETLSRISLDFAAEVSKRKAETYVLPDGKTINIDHAQHLRCNEAYFYPGLVGCNDLGIHEMLIDIMAFCDKDKEQLRSLTNFIMFTGGISFIPGLEQRILKEINSHQANGIFTLHISEIIVIKNFYHINDFHDKLARTFLCFLNDGLNIVDTISIYPLFL
jgi:actin-related protein